MTKQKTSLKDLKSVLKVLRENGVMSYKNQGVELLMHPEAMFPQKRVKESKQEAPAKLDPTLKESKRSKKVGDYTDEEVLFWSSPSAFESEGA
jgi:hypothetical protein